MNYLSLMGGGALHQFRCPISSILHQSCYVIFSPKTVQVEKQKKTYVCLEYKDLLSRNNFELKRIKAAKVVPMRGFQVSFAPTVFGLRTGLIRSTNMFFGLSFVLKSASVNFELCLKYLIQHPLHVKFLVGKYV